MQRPLGLPGLAPLVGLARLLERTLVVEERPGPDLVLDGVDALQARPDEVLGGDFAAADGLGGLASAKFNELHESLPSSLLAVVARTLRAQSDWPRGVPV